MNDDTNQQIAETVRGMLALVFEVDEKRIDVRFTSEPVGDGTMRTKLSVDLDGKTPPPKWCERIEAFMGAIARAANAAMPGAVRSMTSGTTEDGPNWRIAGGTS